MVVLIFQKKNKFLIQVKISWLKLCCRDYRLSKDPSFNYEGLHLRGYVRLLKLNPLVKQFLQLIVALPLEIE